VKHRLRLGWPTSQYWCITIFVAVDHRSTKPDISNFPDITRLRPARATATDDRRRAWGYYGLVSD